ncbi:MAG: ABC transporter permease [Zavarzinella sp.]
MTGRQRQDLWLYLPMGLIGSFYILLIVGMIVGDLQFTTIGHFQRLFAKPEIRYAIRLTLASCALSTLLSLWVGIPLGYLLARTRFRGKILLDTLLDIPIVLPPLVLGISLLILFQTPPGKWCDRTWKALFGTEITYEIPSVILAQFAVCCAFVVRTMRVTFEQIAPRGEQVARTLGCTRVQAFWLVTLPEAWRGIVTAASISWARALGEFGPILIFSGATRMRTEVLSTSVFLEFSVGDLSSAVALSLLLIAVAVLVLVTMKVAGLKNPTA